MTTLIDLSGAHPSPAPAARAQTPAAVRARTGGERTVPLSPTFRPPFIPDAEAQADWDSHLRGVVEY